LPVLKDLEEIITGEEPAGDEEPEMGDRPSVGPDGEVEMFQGNYDEWLQHMDEDNPAWVEKTLGPKKYDLWKAGKLTLSSMS
jgi:hypothetical protein